MFGRAINLTTGIRDPLYRASRMNGQLYAGPDFFHRRLSSITSDRLSGYQRADVRVTWSTLGHWEFYGEVLNVFNNRNQRQTIRQTSETGEQVEIGKADIYNTFGRMFSYGMRVTF